jgi:hypothetical protein
LGKKFYNSLKTGPNFFLQHLKNKIIFNFVKFVATKKGLTIIFFSPLSFVAVLGSEIRDLEWVKIRIRDKHPGSLTLYGIYRLDTWSILIWDWRNAFSSVKLFSLKASCISRLSSSSALPCASHLAAVALHH